MRKKVGKEGWMIPGREKLAMIVGSGAVPAMQSFVQGFLSIYILMVGISPAVAATVLLILKIWDAVNDMIFGFLVDKYRFKIGKNKFTKWLFSGRYMPWFRLLFAVIPVGTVILFTISTELPLWLRITQYCVGYFLFDLGTTATGAYGLLPLSTTNNYDERSFLISWTVLGNGLGSLPVVFLGTIMIAGSTGYAGAAVVFSILGLVLALLPAVLVKERNVVEINPEQQKKYTLKEMLRTLKVMPELVWLMVGTLIWGLFYTSSYGLFVSYYIFENASLSILLTLFGVLPTLVMVPIVPILCRYIDKIMIARIACGVFAVIGVLFCVLGPNYFKNHIGILCLFSGLQSVSYVMTMFSGGQLNPDLAEIARYRTGQDVAGIVAAIGSFVSKFVASVASSVTLLILGAYGFVAVEASSFEELAALNAKGIGLQTERALEGLWNVQYLFPLIGFAIAGIAFCFVKIKRKQVQIVMQVNSGQISHEEGEELLAKM